MKATVIGPGALGCLFAARLTSAGITTTLVDHNRDRAARLGRLGLGIESDGVVRVVYPSVATEVPPRQDIVIILVKSYSTHMLKLPAGVPVLTLQSGLGNVETLCEMVGASNVLGGATNETSVLLGEGRVRHTSSGKTAIGAWTVCPVAPAAEALSAAGFAIEMTDAPGQAIWEQAAVDAGISPVSALLNVPNGKLLELREARELIRDLVVEAAKVAATEGYRFSRSLVERAEAACRASADHYSSMLQDVQAGKRTEIEMLSGEILRRGQAALLPTPRTRVIYQLIRGLEER